MKRRLILVPVFALLFALPLAAQAIHRVARIDVRGNVPAKIVVTQSALEEGRSYSDKDLEVAVARLRRLPFVFDARYSMEGETLVIEIDAVSRFFADLEAFGTGFEHDESGVATLGGGGRLFLGSGGVAQGRVVESVAEHTDSTVADLEYTHYGIAGTRFFAGAGIGYSALNDEGFEPDPTFRLFLGYPINVRQTVTALATDEGFRRSRNLSLAPRALRSFGDRQTVSLRWTYDTTEDPFFARSGLQVNAGPRWAREESQSEAYSITFPDLRFDIITSRDEGTTTTLAADATKFWSVGTRGALFAGALLSYDRTEGEQSFQNLRQDVEIDATSTGLSVGYAYNLFDRLGTTATRQRLEFATSYTRHSVDQPFSPFVDSIKFDATTFSAAYVLRRQFATVKLGLSYTLD